MTENGRDTYVGNANAQLKELLEEVTRISASVTPDARSSLGVLESLAALSSDIASAVASSKLRSEEQQAELVEVFTNLRDAITWQISLLSSTLVYELRRLRSEVAKLPESQMAAAVVGAALTSRWTAQASDPSQVAGRLWVVVFSFLAGLDDEPLMLSQVKDELLTKGVSGDIASAMLNKLQRERVLVPADDGTYRVDRQAATFVRACEVINRGALPLL